MGDDCESPSEELINQLKNNRAIVNVMDPYNEESHLSIFENDVYKALKSADALILMIAHDEFRNLDFTNLKVL